MHFVNRFTLHTPESVELEFTLAAIGNRAWALVIDYHVLGLLLVVFLIVWSIISATLVNAWGQLFRGVNLGIWLVAIALIVGFFIRKYGKRDQLLRAQEESDSGGFNRRVLSPNNSDLFTELFRDILMTKKLTKI